jgi:uroporphyrinogen-III decarboxylase
MNSRERILNSINHLPVDHTPLWLRFWPMHEGVDNIPFPWQDQIERAASLVQQGLDDTLLLEPPLGYVEAYNADHVPGIRSRVRRLPPAAGEGYPLLEKTYQTPAGTLRQVVKVTADWPHGNDIPLFSDFNIPRQKEALIKDLADLERLKYLFGDPSAQQLDEFHQRAALLRRKAAGLGVVLEGGWSALGDAAFWLLGMERVLYAQMDEPQFVEALLDVLCEWELKRIDLLLEEGIDVMVHMAWYEGSDFWTPANYRRMLKPRLARLIEKVHARGVKFRYIITKGWKPLRKDFLEMGIDCLSGVDPVQDNVGLGEVKQEIGTRICLMGGVNSSVMFTQWSDDQIRQAVVDAVECLAPGSGFILYPVDQVADNLPWHKVQVLIDQWREISI